MKFYILCSFLRDSNALTRLFPCLHFHVPAGAIWNVETTGKTKNRRNIQKRESHKDSSVHACASEIVRKRLATIALWDDFTVGVWMQDGIELLFSSK